MLLSSTFCLDISEQKVLINRAAEGGRGSRIAFGFFF